MTVRRFNPGVASAYPRFHTDQGDCFMLDKNTLYTTPLFLIAGDAAGARQSGIGTDEHKVYFTRSCGHTVTTTQAYPNVYKLEVGAGTDTIYLPFFNEKISSIEVPTTGPSVFLTDNLSGCAVIVARHGNGNLVVFHANTTEGSDEKTMKSHKPSYQSPKALSILENLKRTAMGRYTGLTLLGALYKSQYNAGVDAMTKKASGFQGGTLAAGFRTGTTWKFYFQTFGSVGGSATRILDRGKWLTA
jgi:hypothetical protein